MRVQNPKKWQNEAKPTRHLLLDEKSIGSDPPQKSSKESS